VLREHHESLSRPATGYVFPSATGGPIHPSNASVEFHRVVGAANLPEITPHGLRHTHASLLLSLQSEEFPKGVPVEVVSQRLGHASVSFTLDTYRHVYPRERRAAAVPLTDLVATPGPRVQSQAVRRR
jgi:integrase